MDNNWKHTSGEKEDLSFLDSFSKDDPLFRTPEGYFDVAGKQIMERIEEEEFIKQNAPVLHTISKNNIFIVPTVYWEQFNTSLKAKLDKAVNPFLHASFAREKVSFRKISYGIAAAIAISLMGVWYRTVEQQEIFSQPEALEVSLAGIPTETLMKEINGKTFSDIDNMAKMLEREGIEDIHLGYLPQEWLSNEESELLLEDLDVSDIKEEWFQ